MPTCILHLLDESTNADAFEILSAVRTLPYEHHIAGLGHAMTLALAAAAGIPPAAIIMLPSLGWADPRGKRSLKRLIQRLQPSHIHAWGTSAALHAHAVNFAGTRLATFTHTPSGYAVQLLRRSALSSRKNQSPVAFIAASASIRSHLLHAGVAEPRVRIIRPGTASAPQLPADDIRRKLAISPTDHPILLHTGEGKNGRQDFALWTAAIIRQLFPKTRLILQEDPRAGGFPGLERFAHLPDEEMLITAPASIPWASLLPAANVVLVTATGEIPTGALRAAMRAGIPIVATPVPCITEFLTHNKTALIARRTGVGIAPPKGRNTIQPRAIAAELERLLTTPSLARSVAASAKLSVENAFPEIAALQAYNELYRGPDV